MASSGSSRVGFPTSEGWTERNSRLPARALRSLLTRLGLIAAALGLAGASLLVANPASASQATPGQIQSALRYAESFIGKNHDNGLCLAFVAAAWSSAGVSLGSSYDPVTYWAADPRGYLEHSSPHAYNNPPAGALVFWGANPWSSLGHVAISIGNNTVVSTAAYPYAGGNRNNPDVFTFNLSQRNPSTYNYLGYIMPLQTATSTAPTAPPPATIPPPPPATHTETVGGVSHTWTNYADAGGTQGPSIASNTSVQISCKVTGFRVADGNTWWYRIASSPWNNGYYVSADAFYNNGATSGSLAGTPFVDPAVPNC